ncbi:uncharacterized mitochondrial protein AtMg00810-like [Arachis hypogaea]|uniref:uncharacterized mitochondrial protein AtMg00810-like n=1 Tax=Arachis hypogaea TaxID=3818 RepID=UPI003B20E3A2
MNKHTKKTCFRIVGYLEWWEDNHKKSKNKSGQGRGATAVGFPEVTSNSDTGEEEGENRRTQHGKASVAPTQQGSDNEEIARLRRNLFTEFEMKDLDGLKHFLGIEVLRSNKEIFISQRKYILDLLAETGMVDCKPADTPMQVNHGLRLEEDSKLVDKERYQRLVGKLIYLSHTRPDIAYALGVVSQFMHQPQENHMEAVMRIVRYLKGTPGSGIWFKRNGHLNIEVYTDADWAGNPNDRRSTSSYFTLVGGNLVAWRSKK